MSPCSARQRACERGIDISLGSPHLATDSHGSLGRPSCVLSTRSTSELARDRGARDLFKISLSLLSSLSLGINGLQDPLIGLMNLRNSSLSESPSAVSSLLNTYPQITTVLPNSLLPTPTYSRPPYLFNTTAFYSFDNASSATRTSIIPIPTEGLGNSTYIPLAIDTGGKITTLGGGQTPLPTAQRATLDARQSVELLSQRSSVLAAATATWVSGANHPNGACERVSGGIGAPVVLAGLFAWALMARDL